MSDHGAGDGQRARPARAALRLLALAPLTQLGIILGLIWTRTGHLPTWDEWEMANFLELADRGRLDWSAFWGFQNEHRIVLPRLILYGLIELTGWQRQVIMTINLGIGVAMAALLGVAVYRCVGRRAFTLIAVPLSLLLFSFAQYENWLFAFQTNFILAGFGVACCVLGTTPLGATQRHRRWGFPLAFAGALIASLSTFGGLLTWPTFLIAVWPIGRRWAILWGLGAAAIGIPYLIGFPRGTTALASPGELLAYGLAYLGAPLGFPTVGLAIGYGTIGLLLMAFNLVALRRDGGWSTRLLPWLALALFALAGAALTTAGRASLGSGQAITSRYQIFSTYWWLSLLLITAILGLRLRGRIPLGGRRRYRIVRSVNIAVLSLCLIGLVRANLLGFLVGRDWQDRQIAREDCALRYDTASDDCLLTFYVSAPGARIHLAFLEQHGLSIFRDRAPNLAALTQGGGAQGSIDLVNGQAPAAAPLVVSATAPVTLRGWALDGATRGRARAIYILIDGRDIYRATDGYDRPDVARAVGLTAGAKVGFDATLPPELLPPGRHTLSVRIVTADGRARADGAQPLTIEVR